MKGKNIFTLPTLPSSLSSIYTVVGELGRGAFSTVYKIKSNINQQFYCLKKINLKKTQDKYNEIHLLQSLSHNNLVKYISSINDDTGIYIIMEYCEYGDLYSLLHSVRKKKVFVNEDIIWDIAYQSLLALEYLHNKHIIHRDIKLLNIFLSKDKIVKIGDFGMSKLLANKEMKMSRVGTPLYLAPELVKKEKYDYKADIWSLGCSLYHLAKTIPPFNDENLIRLGYAIVNNQPEPLPECYSHQLNQFIQTLMTKDKKLRPSASDSIKLIPDRIKAKYNNKVHREIKVYNSRTAIESPRQNILSNHFGHISNYSTSTSSNHNSIKGGGLGIAGKMFNRICCKKKSDVFRQTNRNFFLNHSINSNSSDAHNNGMTGFFMSKTLGGTQEGFFKPVKIALKTNNIQNIKIEENKDKSIEIEKKDDEMPIPKQENKTCTGFYKPNLNFTKFSMMKMKPSSNKQLIENEPSIEEDDTSQFRHRAGATQVVFPKIKKDNTQYSSKTILSNKSNKEYKEYNLFRTTFTACLNPSFNRKVLTIHDLG